MTALVVQHSDGTPVPLVDGVVVLVEANKYLVSFPGTVSGKPSFGALALKKCGKDFYSLRVGHTVGSNILRLHEGNQEYSWPVRITPRPEKIPESCWLSMLVELEAWLPGSSVGLGGGRLGEVGEDGASVPLLVEALIPLLPALEQALGVVLSSPRRRDVSNWTGVPARQVRKIDGQTTRWIGRHSEVANWLQPWLSVDLEGAPPTIPQCLTVETVDHPANRYVSWLISRVLKKLEDATLELRRLSRSPDREVSIWCSARADKVERGLNRLRTIWRRSFLYSLDREPPSEATLLIILDDPAYARVHRLARRFLSPLFSFVPGAASDYSAAVRPSFTIYEVWCFLALQRILASSLDGAAWTHKGLGKLTKLAGSGSGAAYTGTTLEGVLRIEFNPSFTGYLVRKRQDRWSLSGERRPDIVVSWLPRNGVGTWLFLDAKYRVGHANLADAFSSVHIYRDSLRYESRGGESVSGYLLAPDCSEKTAVWFSKEYREQFRSGIWELRPGVVREETLGDWILGELMASNFKSSR